MSTHNYKTYINDLLIQLAGSGYGSYINTTYTGAPTCADDVVLMASNINDLQIQLNIASDYANQERYQIHPDKSRCVSFGVNHPASIILDGTAIVVGEKLTHLGINRYSNTPSSNCVPQDRISTARRTAYLLMGSGFHGVNGISPHISIKIYRSYVLPRLMYGLESIVLKTKHITELEAYHKKTLRELQSLPVRTASSAVYLMSGIPPLEALLDQQIANLLSMVGSGDSKLLAEIGTNQLARKSNRSSSWFVYSSHRLTKYGLDPLAIIEGRIKKVRIKSIIMNYWASTLIEEAKTKTSLRFLKVDSCNLNVPHPVWQSVGCNPADTRKAIQKARILTGTYILQSNKANFNQFEVDPTCPLCGAAPEDRLHFITACVTLQDIRAKYMENMESLIPGFKSIESSQQLQIILDPFTSNHNVTGDRAVLEAISRNLIFSLHCKRQRILNESSS